MELEMVWVQNLRGFINGHFPLTDEWKQIFLKNLSALATPAPAPEIEGLAVAWRWRLEGMWKPGEFSYGPSEPMSERPSGWTIEPLVPASALTAMAGKLREARAENAELDFLLNEGGTWEQQLSASESRVAELTAEVERLTKMLKETQKHRDSLNADWRKERGARITLDAEVERLTKERDDAVSRISEMAERFRAVNVTEAVKQTIGEGVFELRAEVERLREALMKVHDWIANGDEYADAATMDVLVLAALGVGSAG